MCCLQETLLTCKDIHRLNGWKIIFQANGIWKKAGVAILIANKIDFKAALEETKKVTIYN